MFAEIILHRRVPSNFESFTYQVPKDLKVEPGQIVRVPFRKQKLAGIVLHLHEKMPSYPTKPLESALPIVLAPWQMELAAWMSEYYKCAFSKVIDFFIPEKIWNEPKKNPAAQKAQEKNKTPFSQLSLQESNPLLQKDCLASLRLGLFAKKFLGTRDKKLVVENTLLPRKAFYNYIANFLPQDSQALFLFQEFSHIEMLNLDLPVFHGGLNETQKAMMWQSVLSGETKIIAGTRTALFLPFKKLSAIVLDFEHSESYLEKRQPNYHALEVAEKLAQLWKIPLIVISATPRVETWFKFEKNGWEDAQIPPKVSIIDMADERRKGNNGIFAEKTTESIAKCLSQNQQVLLFINRKGEASALFCRDCGNIFRCEECNSPLTVHKEAKLQCHRCRTIQQMPMQCGKCKSVELKALGLGTEGIEREIKKIFGRAVVFKIDKEAVHGLKKIKMPLNDQTLG